MGRTGLRILMRDLASNNLQTGKMYSAPVSVIITAEKKSKSCRAEGSMRFRRFHLLLINMVRIRGGTG